MPAVSCTIWNYPIWEKPVGATIFVLRITLGTFEDMHVYVYIRSIHGSQCGVNLFFPKFYFTVIDEFDEFFTCYYCKHSIILGLHFVELNFHP
jgi:hypothetical protein